jgi:uncharacterized membrane protein (UPF0182 family)
MNLKKYNLIPPAVWILLLVAFEIGFFTGAIVQHLAVKKNEQNTCDWLKHG